MVAPPPVNHEVYCCMLVALEWITCRLALAPSPVPVPTDRVNPIPPGV